MALRLRRDVQKASYYVWFLGAEEARGLRGPQVMNPVVPILVQRAREEEPLKVTLQLSHKGIKILQGSVKHFIPHSAITSSIQIDDIVACVLLLYNPATKCPLHVHAYRCDSEATAKALHQQLQVLIKRPENQKRLAELEARLGQFPPMPREIEEKRAPRRIESSPKRFESSLGSDTGNSTRESECSEEHSVTTPVSPIPKVKTSLFGSLAAELRAKLNGNGPPLLLPPRDYDTVHRSKGNLAAIELRRCRNTLIVGSGINSSNNKHVVSSRGSSGIGSDFAPSPERSGIHSSSEDEAWSNDVDNSAIPHHMSRNHEALEENSRHISNMDGQGKQKLQMKKSFGRDPYDAAPDHYRSMEREKEIERHIEPRKLDRQSDRQIDRQMEHRQIDRQINRQIDRKVDHHQVDRYVEPRENEIRPIIMRPPDFDLKFKKVMLDRRYSDKKESDVVDNHHTNNSNNNNNNIEPNIHRQDRKFIKNVDEKRSSSIGVAKLSQELKHDIEKTFDNKLSLDNMKRYSHDRDQYDYQYDHEKDRIRHKENYTDRLKYQEAYLKQQQEMFAHERNSAQLNRQKHREERPRQMNPSEPIRYSNYRSPAQDQTPTTTTTTTTMPHHSNHQEETSFSQYKEKNPYTEPESIPYRESIENMIKSPAMKYKQFNPRDDTSDLSERVNNIPKPEIRTSINRRDMYQTRTPDSFDGYNSYTSDSRLSKSSSPESSVLKYSPKERFQDAKEKFRAMERSRFKKETGAMIEPPTDYQKSSNHHHRGRSLERNEQDTHFQNWSDEEKSMRRDRYGAVMHEYHNGNGMSNNKYREVHHENMGYPPIVTNAKSLSNLTKGHRHSYAEPRPALSRSNRVGLAAVNPF